MSLEDAIRKAVIVTRESVCKVMKRQRRSELRCAPAEISVTAFECGTFEYSQVNTQLSSSSLYVYSKQMQVGRNIKRPRSISSSSGSSSQASSSRSLSSTPPPKFHKPVQSTHTNQYTCNLPPTCSQPHTSTSYPTEEDLERHQETFHRWVCRTSVRNRNTHPQHQDPFAVPEGFIAGKWKECGKVFPEERYLSLVGLFPLPTRSITCMHTLPSSSERRGNSAHAYVTVLMRTGLINAASYRMSRSYLERETSSRGKDCASFSSHFTIVFGGADESSLNVSFPLINVSKSSRHPQRGDST